MLHLSASIVTLTHYQVIKLQKDGWMVTSKTDRLGTTASSLLLQHH